MVAAPLKWELTTQWTKALASTCGNLSSTPWTHMVEGRASVSRPLTKACTQAMQTHACPCTHGVVRTRME